MSPPRSDLAPPKDDPFTLEQLKVYDGKTEGKPIYVAIKGVYYMSRRRHIRASYLHLPTTTTSLTNSFMHF